MTFKRERADEVIAALMPLVRAHYDEVSAFQDFELSPDVAQYKAADAMGSLRLFTARDEKGELCGYAAFVVSLHHHYESLIRATQDTIYMAPEHRGSYGKAFLTYCETALKHEGVDVIFHATSERRNFAPVLERMGYRLIEHLYAKRVS